MSRPVIFLINFHIIPVQPVAGVPILIFFCLLFRSGYLALSKMLLVTKSGSKLFRQPLVGCCLSMGIVENAADPLSSWVFNIQLH